MSLAAITRPIESWDDDADFASDTEIPLNFNRTQSESESELEDKENNNNNNTNIIESDDTFDNDNFETITNQDVNFNISNNDTLTESSTIPQSNSKYYPHIHAASKYNSNTNYETSNENETSNNDENENFLKKFNKKQHKSEAIKKWSEDIHSNNFSEKSECFAVRPRRNHLCEYENMSPILNGSLFQPPNQSLIDNNNNNNNININNEFFQTDSKSTLSISMAKFKHSDSHSSKISNLNKFSENNTSQTQYNNQLIDDDDFESDIKFTSDVLVLKDRDQIYNNAPSTPISLLNSEADFWGDETTKTLSPPPPANSVLSTPSLSENFDSSDEDSSFIGIAFPPGALDLKNRLQQRIEDAKKKLTEEDVFSNNDQITNSNVNTSKNFSHQRQQSAEEDLLQGIEIGDGDDFFDTIIESKHMTINKNVRSSINYKKVSSTSKKKYHFSTTNSLKHSKLLKPTPTVSFSQDYNSQPISLPKLRKISHSMNNLKLENNSPPKASSVQQQSFKRLNNYNSSINLAASYSREATRTPSLHHSHSMAVFNSHNSNERRGTYNFNNNSNNNNGHDNSSNDTTKSPPKLSNKKSMQKLKPTSETSESAKTTPKRSISRYSREPYSQSNDRSGSSPRKTSMHSSLRRGSESNRPPFLPAGSNSHHVTQRFISSNLLKHDMILATETLKAPVKSRIYGDGSELDFLEDLPTNSIREKQLTLTPSGSGILKFFSDSNNSGNLVKRMKSHGSRQEFLESTSKRGNNFKNDKDDNNRRITDSSKGHKRLIPPSPTKTSILRDRAIQASINQRDRREAKKGPYLIRPLGKVGKRPMVQSGMHYNPKTLEWEGNYKDGKIFEISTPPRPALISNLSSTKGVQVVGRMLFDPSQMRWLKIDSDSESESDPFAGIDDLEEDDGHNDHYRVQTDDDLNGSPTRMSNKNINRQKRRCSDNGALDLKRNVNPYDFFKLTEEFKKNLLLDTDKWRRRVDSQWFAASESSNAVNSELRNLVMRRK